MSTQNCNDQNMAKFTPQNRMITITVFYTPIGVVREVVRILVKNKMIKVIIIST